MDIFREIDLLIGAKYPLIYIVTWEEDRVIKELQKIAAKRARDLYVWSASGFAPAGTRSIKKEHPIAALDEFLASKDELVLILLDLHPSLVESQAPTVRKLRDVVTALKSSPGKTAVILSPTQRIPLELEKDITVIDYPLPDVAQLETVLNDFIKKNEDDPTVQISLDTPSAKEKVLKAALGLTLSEAERVMSKAIEDSHSFSEKSISFILDEKKQIIQKSRVLEYISTDEAFENIGGLDQLKQWLKKRGEAFTEEARRFGLREPRGIMLIGVPGCGKSLCAKAIAVEWDKPLLRLELGNLFSSHLGSSEENMRKAIRIAESISPAILWIDEIEKGFSGTGSSSDSGTTGRIFGAFITWMQEKTKPVFVVATANDISKLPPELVRKGRFDEIFFVDLPDMNERQHIFEIHLRKLLDPQRFQEQLSNGLDLVELAALTEHFSGAEIEEVVIAALYDAFAIRNQENRLRMGPLLQQSIEATMPLAVTMGGTISGVREWAKTRAVPASSQRRSRARVSQDPAFSLSPKVKTPFAFDDSYIAKTIEDFLMGAKTRKSEMGRDLGNGRLEHWLRDNGLEPIAREAIRVRENTTNVEVGVDTLLNLIEKFIEDANQVRIQLKAAPKAVLS